MFRKSAYIYDELYSFLDYTAASNKVHELIQKHQPEAKNLLDVACGSGKCVGLLEQHYQAQGLDISPELVDFAQTQYPDLKFHQGDMLNFNLDEKFDVITCLFCSIAYTKTLENITTAIACMAQHLQPGGLLMVEPWVNPDNYWENKVNADFVNKPELKIVRMHTYAREGNVSVLDYHYMVGTPDGIESFTERTELGLFTQQEYLTAFEKAGLETSFYDIALFPKHKYGVYMGVKKD